jgi:hypothetical protein
MMMLGFAGRQVIIEACFSAMLLFGKEVRWERKVVAVLVL